MTEEDFVFNYNATDTYLLWFGMVISGYPDEELEGGFNEEGVLMKWLAGFVLNPDSPPLAIRGGKEALPEEYALQNAYPNPFNPTTTIEYSLIKSEEVSLVVFDLAGKEVAKLVHGYTEAGHHTVKWNASNYSSGIYFYRLQAGDFVQTRKMVLLK